MEMAGVDAVSTVGREQLWVELDRSHDWDDLVLSAPERELLQTLAANLGLDDHGVRANGETRRASLLLVGDTEQGETEAAGILSDVLAQPVFQQDIDLRSADDATIADVTARVDDAARRGDGIVLFDGVRSFLGWRAAASGEPGTIRPARLVTAGEHAPGVVIFAWKPTTSVDRGGEDGDLLAEFPFPGAGPRRAIWARELPPEAELAAADVSFLSWGFRLSAGAIHRCCTAATAEAAREGRHVGMAHVAQAIDRSYPGAAVDESAEQALRRLRSGQRRGAGRRARQERSRRARRRGWVLAVAAGVAACAIGFAVSRATHGPASSPPPRAHLASASTMGLSVSLPAGWSQHPPPSLIQGLSGAIAVAPRGSSQGMLVIGNATTPDPTLIPPALLRSLPTPPVAQAVTLGGVQFYRYANVLARGATVGESVYALPTTKGTIVGLCSGGTVPRIAADCESILATLRLSSGSPLPLGPSSAYASALDRVLRTLSTARGSAGAKLRAAKSPNALAAAANQLAAAHAHAGSALMTLNAGRAGLANAALARALRSTAAAYTALARAAAGKHQSAYRAATSELSRRAASVNSALSELGKLGYRESDIRGA